MFSLCRRIKKTNAMDAAKISKAPSAGKRILRPKNTAKVGYKSYNRCEISIKSGGPLRHPLLERATAFK
jgi:hypothetical protein